MDDTQEKRIRFGQYEADLKTAELRKNGRAVRLQEQPFQVLAALLVRAGEVVTREELRERLWPSDSFGDFDQGLNTAINKAPRSARRLGREPAVHRNSSETWVPVHASHRNGTRGIQPLTMSSSEPQPGCQSKFLLAIAAGLRDHSRQLRHSVDPTSCTGTATPVAPIHDSPAGSDWHNAPCSARSRFAQRETHRDHCR